MLNALLDNSSHKSSQDSYQTARCIYTKNALLFRCTLMILNLLRIRRKANRKVYNYRKNVSHCRSLSTLF